MKTITIATLLTLVLLGTGSVFAQNQTAQYFNGPSIKNITNTSAEVSLSSEVLAKFSAEEKAQLYFEYTEPERACIMIYPTPAECLPKKTLKGQTSISLTGLTPNTLYTVSYKKDNTIACITTPCPTNELESLSVSFKTVAGAVAPFSTTLRFRMSGGEVSKLQDVLRTKGYLNVPSTGYFGTATLRAVKAFQKAHNIPPTGLVAARTRAALNAQAQLSEEHFEGTIQSVSLGCFVDGICSVTVDGKTIVTTIGWSQDTVGSIKGTVQSIGDIETQKIGARARVYAKKKTPSGYTLYGNANYFIEVL